MIPSDGLLHSRSVSLSETVRGSEGPIGCSGESGSFRVEKEWKGDGQRFSKVESAKLSSAILKIRTPKPP
jgi:hypothetical protein